MQLSNKVGFSSMSFVAITIWLYPEVLEPYGKIKDIKLQSYHNHPAPGGGSYSINCGKLTPWLHLTASMCNIVKIDPRLGLNKKANFVDIVFYFLNVIPTVSFIITHIFLPKSLEIHQKQQISPPLYPSTTGVRFFGIFSMDLLRVT